MDTVMDERSGGVQVTLRHHHIGAPQVLVHDALNNAPDDILHLLLVNVNESEGGEVGPVVLCTCCPGSPHKQPKWRAGDPILMSPPGAHHDFMVTAGTTHSVVILGLCLTLNHCFLCNSS